MSNDAVRRTNELQNRLQATQRLVQAQKLEYEEELRLTALERRAAEEALRADLTRVTTDLERVRAMALEDRRR